MSGFSNETAAQILEAAFKAEAYAEAAENWLALLSAPAAASDTGATMSEVSYTGYARVKLKASQWGELLDGVIKNLAVVKFGACTAGSDNAKGWAYLDEEALGKGRIIFSGRGPTAHISSGIEPEYGIGALVAKLLTT